MTSKPPIAPRHPSTTTHHGVTLSDEFDRGKTVAALTKCVGEFYSDMNVRFVTDRPSRLG